MPEERSAEIALSRVRKNCHDAFARAELAGHLEGRVNVGARTDAAQEPFLQSQLFGGVEGVLIADDAAGGKDLGVEILRNKAVADAHLQVRFDGAAGLLGFPFSYSTVTCPFPSGRR